MFARLFRGDLFRELLPPDLPKFANVIARDAHGETLLADGLRC